MFCFRLFYQLQQGQLIGKLYSDLQRNGKIIYNRCSTADSDILCRLSFKLFHLVKVISFKEQCQVCDRKRKYATGKIIISNPKGCDHLLD